MRNLFCIIICLISFVGIQAKDTPGFEISGKIIDGKTGSPVSFADVTLHHVKDSLLVKHDMSDENGQYKFIKIDPGKYFLKAKILGYRDQISQDFNVSTENIEVKEIIMEGDTQLLEEVTVTTKKQFIEQQADRMVINPEATITTATDNILDVLAKSPGIVVDKDGNISLKGKSGITVLIDDKQTHLNAEQLAAMLKNLQATSVERIEIIENPPAKYDAEGSSGIINIKTKRGKVRGWNGSFTLGNQIGEKWRGNTGLDLNYRNEKWNVYGNFYAGVNNNKSTIDLTRGFPEGDGSIFYESSDMKGHSDYGGIKLGADYYLNSSQIIGIMGRFSGWGWTGDADSKTTVVDMLGNTIRNEKTFNEEDESGNDWSFNMNYKWNIDTTGRSLSADLDYAHYKYTSENNMNTSYIPITDPLISKNNQSSYTNIYSVKVDYEHPLDSKNRLDAGFKSSFVDIDSDLTYKQIDHSSGEWDDPNKMSNHFKYSENINALYASYKRKWNDKFDMQVGLRGEQTRTKGNNVTIDSINKRNYFDLFPTVFFQETFSDKHQLNLSYAYRIGRPNYWLLNPFVWMLNPYTYNQGNPDLQPQFTHSVKLSYTLNQKYILSMGYAYTKDQYTQMFEQNDDTKITVISWRNLNNVNNADITLTIPVQIKKFCQINANMTTYYLQYKSPMPEGTMLDRSKITFRGNMTAGFTLPKDWSFELSGWYMSRSIYGMMDFKPMGSMDFGIQKQIPDKKITVKLSVSDVFKTQGQKYYSDYQNMDLTGIQKYDSRRLQLNLSWRFGKDNVKPARQRSTGLEEEAGRTGK